MRPSNWSSGSFVSGIIDIIIDFTMGTSGANEINSEYEALPVIIIEFSWSQASVFITEPETTLFTTKIMVKKKDITET